MNAPFRFPRAVAFTAAMFALAAGAHVLAGGSLPQPAIVAGLVALVLAPVMILSKIRLNAPGMIGLLSVGQWVLHEAFSVLAASTGFTPVDGGHVHTGLQTHPLAVAVMPEHAAAPSVLMLVLHGAATLATAMVLARGEAAAWALAAWLLPLVRILTALVIPDWPRLPAAPATVVPSRWRNLRLPALRGPPAFHAAL
ncbi:hypothetical protein [Pseudarthrobacter sp. NPDC080039]|uniref:hypothetical protein n=1 Tax=unclassified Pseudarthrobacter TaxID=2647000 RepID=UPI00344E8474